MMFEIKSPLLAVLLVSSVAGCGGTSLAVDGGVSGTGGAIGSGGATGGAPGSGGVSGSGGFSGSGGVSGSGGFSGSGGVSGSGGAITTDGGSPDAGLCKTSECPPPPPFAAPQCDGGTIRGAACVRNPNGGCSWVPPSCSPSCPGLGCLPNCPYGVKLDSNGCDTCQCKPAPMCGPICDIFCEFGNVKDANGCDTCQCNPPPDQPTSCDRKNCPSPAPGAPNYICPDGKTIAGPACVTQVGGSCGWVFITCPPQCVQNGACIAGAHWDPTLCKCVPAPCPCKAGEVCVQQIGGPAIKDPPPMTCEVPNPTCLLPKTSPCACLSPADGRCKPSADDSACVCDNGIR